MDYRIDDSAAEMSAALVTFLSDRMPDPAAEPDRAARAVGWRALVGSDWLEHYTATAGDKDVEPAELVLTLHVAEAFGRVPVTGPVSVVAGYLHPLARLAGLNSLAECLRDGSVTTGPLPMLDGSADEPRWRAARLPVRRDGDRLTLSGSLAALPSLADAARVVVPVEHDGRPALAMVPTDSPGVRVGPPGGIDLRNPVASLELADVRLPDGAVHTAEGGAELPELEHRAGLLASLFLDAEAVGGATEVLTRSVAYCTERVQFGRPIGSFQAVRHRLADAAVRTEGARSLVQRTGWDVAAGAPGAPVDVLASRLWCSATYIAACEAAIQCHGGMGFTWEQRLHLWHRSALAARGLHTHPSAARAGVAAHLRAMTNTSTVETRSAAARVPTPLPSRRC